MNKNSTYLALQALPETSHQIAILAEKKIVSQQISPDTDWQISQE